MNPAIISMGRSKLEQEEIKNAIHEAAAVPLLRNWNEVTKVIY